jgi:8-oxo-dGTP pyrophosphatase MutT (NUDIX family)
MKVIQLGNIQITIDKGDIPETFDAVVVILFWAEKFVLVWNQERGWEFPGGHREGKETYEETAMREVQEEAQLEIQRLDYLGYYILETGQRTLIVCGECTDFEGHGDRTMPLRVEVFDELPSQLSFGDGREQLFLEVARKSRASS